MESGGGDCRRAGPSSATTSSRSLTRMISPPRAIRTYSDRRAFSCLMPTDFMSVMVVTGSHLCKCARHRSPRRSSRVRDPLPPASRHVPPIHPEMPNRGFGGDNQSALSSSTQACGELKHVRGGGRCSNAESPVTGRTTSQANASCSMSREMLPCRHYWIGELHCGGLTSWFRSCCS